MKDSRFCYTITYFSLLVLIPFYISCATMTPLTQAAKDGNASDVSALLKNGANIDQPNSQHGWTPLYWAIYNDKPDTVQMLLNNGASVNIMDADGNSPLMIAASQGMTKTINTLIERGADINVRNKLQETPLINAVKAADEVSVKILICKGADVELRDISGHNAISYAEYNKSFDIAQLLYKAKYAKRRNTLQETSQMCSHSSMQEEKMEIVELPRYAYSINYHNIRPSLNYTGNRSIAVVVQDQRPYVLSGNNGPEYVGQIGEGGFRPSYISTLTGRPLYQEISYCINETLKWQGFKPVSVPIQQYAVVSEVIEKIKTANVDRVILIKITEWMSQATCHYAIRPSSRCLVSSTYFAYNVSLTVLNEEGQAIAQSHADRVDDLGKFSSFVYLSHFEKVQEATERLLQKLLNSSDVRLALQ
jgi:ankyrin repeat protein